VPGRAAVYTHHAAPFIAIYQDGLTERTITCQRPSSSKAIIEAAITGFETQKKEIDAQIAGLRAVLNGSPEHNAETIPVKRKRRGFTRRAIERMRRAQQERRIEY